MRRTGLTAGVLLPFLLIVLLTSGCRKNGMRIRETGEWIPVEDLVVFRGEITPSGEFFLPVGFFTAEVPHPETYSLYGIQPLFIMSVTSRHPDRAAPGMYPVSPDEEFSGPRGLLRPEIFFEYNLSDYKPVLGSRILSGDRGTFNVYRWSGGKCHVVWNMEMAEELDDRQAGAPTGRTYTVTGRYRGRYIYFDFPVSTEHKGFRVHNEFHPLDVATIATEEGLVINIVGPDVDESRYPGTGIDSLVTFSIPDAASAEVKNGSYGLGDEAQMMIFSEFDFNAGNPVPGTPIYRSISGNLGISGLDREYNWVDFRWQTDVTAENDPLVGDGILPLVGAYSGPLRTD